MNGLYLEASSSDFLSSFFFFFQNSIKQCYVAAKPVILEPVMLVELKVPTEFQGTVAGDINK
jgi:translation elongation factor EF-G